ncbi:pro-sigmaK processing inhibitor BofA family protein [Bacillus sp. FJAT-49736]|uniref:pro-sigmaK processing inhibitor BofA family protein n=1 Tax=Bacillus sp. FJAT-49736 TaxID=2833582 RepID=UPI001BC8CEF0|nr:pro-sigmaK processing inhibitor BofA family protein [Bacillus sp. FJAT-49736]MBS4175876.1 pro-sigmaK processing inhibitor BofA family protein [Bacillus sp. FJAT-49736]MBS4175896.1 pro-sigmaK processing inhibitor BofA family protein [Bacillus sp. FJAT-49736]
MTAVLVASIIIVLLLILLAAGTSGKSVKWIGQLFIRFIIGAVFLFFLNAIGSRYGIHVPINLITTAISGMLGIPGVIGLTIIQTWIIH